MGKGERGEQGETVRESDDLTPVWLMVAMMVACKVALTVYVLVAFPSAGNLAGQLAGNAPYLALILVLIVPPAIYWGRLLRGRAKRARLQRAEWNVD